MNLEIIYQSTNIFFNSTRAVRHMKSTPYKVALFTIYVRQARERYACLFFLTTVAEMEIARH